MLVPHLLKIYFGLGWPSSVLEIVSSQRLKTIFNLKKKTDFENVPTQIYDFERRVCAQTQ